MFNHIYLTWFGLKVKGISVICYSTLILSFVYKGLIRFLVTQMIAQLSGFVALSRNYNHLPPVHVCDPAIGCQTPNAYGKHCVGRWLEATETHGIEETERCADNGHRALVSWTRRHR